MLVVVVSVAVVGGVVVEVVRRVVEGVDVGTL